MTSRTVATLDANEAVARVAYKLNEAIAIYPDFATGGIVTCDYGTILPGGTEA